MFKIMFTCNTKEKILKYQTEKCEKRSVNPNVDYLINAFLYGT